MNDLILHTEVNADGEVVLTAIGVIDSSTAPKLDEYCQRLPVAPRVFDLRYVSLLTAAGISVLAEAHRRCPTRVISSAVVSRVLAVTGLLEVFSIEPPSAKPHLDHASFGVAVHDSELRFTYVNHALAVVNGLEPRAHDGRLPAELFDVIQDDVSPILRDVLRTGNDRRIIVRGATASTEHGAWRCRYWRTRSLSLVTGEPETQVIAVIEHNADTSVVTESSAAALEFVATTPPERAPLAI